MAIARADGPRPAAQRCLLGAALILLVAAALRLVALDDLPPGLYYDESANGVDARRVLAGAHPVFFAGNQGREPLLIYLQAATMALGGPSPLALRLPAVAIGLLTVAATFTAFRSLFGMRAGLIAEALLAFSYWHVSLSRLALRAVGVPLFTTLATFWFWKGIQTGRLRWYALAGFAVAASLYTYLPARLAPLLFATWLLGCVMAPPVAPRASLLRGFLAASLVFALTIAPLASYFDRHPALFIRRIQAEEPVGPTFRPLQGYWRAIDALILAGDINPRQNLPGRPFLDLPVALAAGLGTLVAMRRWRSAQHRFVLGWSLAMLLPAALSNEPYHALRLVGELPFVLGLAALGFDLVARLRWPRHQPLGLAIVVASLGLAGLFSVRDYFFVWPSQPATYDAFEADALHSLRLLNQVPPGAATFVSGNTYHGRPIPLSLIPRVPANVRAFDGLNTFVAPASTSSPVYYVYPRTYTPPGGIPTTGRLSLIASLGDPFGRVDGQVFRVGPPDRPLAPLRPADALIGSSIRVTGVDLQPVIHPGNSLHFALHWTVVGSLPPGQWLFFAHLVRRGDQRLLGQDYNEGFPPDEWRPGDRVITSFRIPVSSTTPAAVADVDAGVFDRVTGRRLVVADPSGRPAGGALVSGPVRVDRLPPTTLPERATFVRFGPSIVLLGYDLDRATDGEISLVLHWTANRVVSQDYTVFVHLLDSRGRLIAGADSQPAGGAFPTSTWIPGEAIPDPHQVRGPATLPTGSRLEVGLYLLATGQRLPAFDSAGKPLGDSVRIGF